MVLLIALLLAGRMAAQVPVLDSVCSGAERYYRVDGEAGSTYVWTIYEPDGTSTTLSSDADTVQVFWNFVPGIYELHATQISTNDCDSLVLGQVIIFESPAVFAGPDDAVCATASYLLADADTTYTSSHQWTSSGDGMFDDITLLYATYTPGPNDQIAGMVTLILTGYGLGDEGTCDPSADSMLLTLTPEVAPLFEPIGPLCQFSLPPALPDTSMNNIGGAWDPPVITTSVVGVTSYTFTPDSGQCSKALVVDIETTELPVVYAGADQTIPNGTGTTIQDATATGIEPLSFFWEPEELLVNPELLHPTTGNLNVTTEFILTVTDLYGCQNTDTMVIYISGVPLAVNPYAVPEVICLGKTAQLFSNAGGGTGTLNYSWTSEPPGFESKEENPFVSPEVTTTYYVEVTDNDTTVIGSVTVTVLPLPVVYAGEDQTINFGTSTTIGDATASGAEPITYFWMPDSLLLDPTVLHPTTVNLEFTTIFTLTVTDVNGCQNSDDMTITVKGGPLVVNPVADPEEICFGGTAQLFAFVSGGSGEYTYDWSSNPPGFSSTLANPVVSPEVTTTYMVVVDDGYNTVTGFVTVTVHPLPEVNAGADQIIFSGSSTVIDDATASGAEPLTYFWSPSNLLVDPTVLNPTTVQLNQTTTFTLTVFDGNGCDNSDQVTIFVQTTPLAVDPTVDPEAICITEPAFLFANASGGSGNYSYLWTSNPPGFSTTEENPPVAPLVTTVYIVEVNDGFSTAIDSITLTVNPLPVVYAGADQVIPIGSFTTIDDATASGAGNLTYAWTPAEWLVDTTVLNPTTVDLYVTTTFTLTVIDSNGCENSDEVVIAVEGEDLFVNPAADPDEICQGGTVQLSANAGGGTGVYTYSWASDPVGFTSNVENPTASPDVTTQYTVVVDDGLNSVVGTVLVTVHPLPEVFAGDDQTIPVGTGASLSDATASGTEPQTYAWTPAVFLLDSTVLNPVTVNLTATTVFLLTVTDANGCENSDEVTIFVEGGALTVAPTALPPEICQGEMVQLFAYASGGSGNYSFGWTSDPPGFSTTEENPSVSPDTTTMYTVEVNDGDTIVSGTVTVTVHPLPEVFAGLDQTILSGTGTTISDATASGAEPLVFSWTPSALLLDSAVLNPTTIDLDSTTVFTLTVTDANGCEASDEVIIEVYEIILDSLEAITGPDELCLGKMAAVPIKVFNFKEVAEFQMKLKYNVDKLYCEGITNQNPDLPGLVTGFINTADGEIVLNWEVAVPVSFSSITQIVDLVFSTREPGQGELEWYTNATESYFKDIDSQPIHADFFAGSVVIYEPPVIYLNEALHFCIGQPVSITGLAQGVHPPLIYEWIYPDGQIYPNEPYFDSVTHADAGTYTLTVTDSLGCTDQKSIRLYVFDNPVALFHGTDTLEVLPEYLLEAGGGMAWYLWNTGETTESIIITLEGMYIVEMMSQAGCIGSDSVYILINQKCFDIPNAFTPDGDGLNDYFEAETICPIKNFRMLIYNRWGEKLFESNDISHGWDGRKNGKLCPGDSYVFIVSYVIEESPGVEEANTVTGIVVLLK